MAQYNTLITDLELTIVREAKRHDADAFHRLRSVPGIGKVLALTILYEIHDITRFGRVQEFASYARLVKVPEAVGRQNARHQWGEDGKCPSQVGLLRSRGPLPPSQRRTGRNCWRRSKRNTAKGKALSILAHKIGRAVFYMLARGTVFSSEKFLAA